jgi:hypothetical protein
MKILKVREWLFDRANQAVVDGARERLIQKAESQGLIIDMNTGVVRFKDSMESLNFSISLPSKIVIGR